MNLLFIDMTGPDFLIFYGALIGTCILILWLIKGYIPVSKEKVRIDTYNEYQLAYLRNGSKELMGVIAYKLIQEGFLLQSNGRIKRSKQPPSHINSLKEEELLVLGYFKIKRSSTLGQLIRSRITRRKIENIYAQEERDFQQEQLIFPNYSRKQIHRFQFFFILFILLIGMIKLNVALERGHNNIGFLILFGLLGVIFVSQAGYLTRLTSRGKQLFDDLKVAHTNSETEHEDVEISSLQLAIFGVGFLMNATDFEALGKSFRKAMGYSGNPPASSGGGCGTSSGSNCGGGGGCGGGGCGGGCGGCGG